jgi:hypothetical protein
MRALRRASLGDVFAMLNDGIFASCGAKNLELKASPSFEYLLLVSFLLFFIILYYSLLFSIVLVSHILFVSLKDAMVIP